MNLVTQQSSAKLTITPESEENSLQADHNNLHTFGLNGDILKMMAADDSAVTETNPSVSKAAARGEHLSIIIRY